jgi:hypothetical protein
VNGQATFTCSWDSPFREDVLSELQIFGMEDFGYKLPASTIDWSMRMRQPPANLKLSYLAQLIEAYSARNLTYPNDISNAFAGIEDMVRQDWKMNLTFGLSQPSMAISLLWAGGILTRREGFPSWSWMGWIGKIICVTDSVDGAVWTSRSSWIKWYVRSWSMLVPFIQNHTSLQPSKRHLGVA